MGTEKIYLLQWIDSDADFTAQREAFYTQADAQKKYSELLKEAETNGDLTLCGFNTDCRVVVIKDKEDLIDLINSLL